MCDGGDCRCEVSFQSYLPFNVEFGIRNVNFGFFGDFSVGVEIYRLLGCIIELQQDRILCESMNGIRSVASEITF